MSVLKKVAVSLARTAEESRQLGDAESVRAKYFLVSALLGLLALILLPTLIAELRHGDMGRPAIVIDQADWKVFYGRSPESCDELVAEAKGCLANPENSQLWKSASTRADRAHNKLTRERESREFWLGLTVPVATLVEARKAEVNQFIVGFLSASYRIWVDGELMLEGSYATSHLPAILSLPLGRLQDNKPLHIAIQINHDARSPVPDMLGGANGEGFASAEQAQRFVYQTLFWNEARPWSLFVVHLLIAAIFLFLWTGAGRKQEYLYMSVYALVHAFLQITQVELVRRGLGYGSAYVLDTVLMVYESAFGMFVGLAFARSRRTLFKWGVPAVLIVPWLVVPVQKDSGAELQLAQMIGMWVMPVFYLLGGFACGAQSWLLGSDQKSGAKIPARIRHLVMFGLVLVAQGVLFHFEARAITTSMQLKMVSGFGHVWLAIALGLILLPTD